jgi:uncharacterized phage protein gp47/JayE
MAFDIPSRLTLFKEWITSYAGAFPEKSIARGTDPYRLGKVVTGTAWSILAKLLFVIKQALPDSATGFFLQRWSGVFAFPKKGPAGALGSAALRVSGTPGAAVPVHSQLTHLDGTQYEVASVGAVVGGGGTVDVDVAAISVGLSTNKITGETLTFAPPPPQITAAAVLVADLHDGRDNEQDEEFRPRFLSHIGDPPEGGAIHDYEEWCLRQAGVLRAFVWAHRRAGGTMDVAVLGAGTGAARIPSALVLAAVDDYIESVRPGNVRDFLVLTTVPFPQDVQCTIEIDDSIYKWDWDDAGVGYTITAFDAIAKTLTFAALPAAATIGARVQVNGEEARITNRVDGGSVVLTLAFDRDHDNQPVTWFTFAVNVGVDQVRASGDLVRPVRFAIMDYFNSLGPARTNFAVTSWSDQLKHAKLFGAITDVAGVDDANIITPATNIAPPADAGDTFGEQIYFLVPGKIEVLKP